MGSPQSAPWAMMRRQPGCALWTSRWSARNKGGRKIRLTGLVEKVVEKEVLELGVLLVRGRDVTEEDGLDDAASAPHERDAGVVEVPLVLLGRLTHEHEALGV